MLVEAGGVLVYGSFYVLTGGRSLVWIGVGWLLHPVWDVGLHLYGPAEHVSPTWYAWACASFDGAVAAYCFHRARREAAFRA